MYLWVAFAKDSNSGRGGYIASTGCFAEAWGNGPGLADLPIIYGAWVTVDESGPPDESNLTVGLGLAARFGFAY